MSHRLPYSLFAFDMDGTMLKADATIPSRNIEAVKQLTENGAYVVLCSGRATWSLLEFKQLFSEKGIDLAKFFVIGFNGGECFSFKDHNTEPVTIFKKGISPDVANAVYDYCYSKNWFIQSYCSSRTCYLAKSDPMNVYVEERNHVLPYKEAEFQFMDTLPARELVPKMLVTVQAPQLPAVMADLREQFPALHMEQSTERFIEILPSGVSKGSAIRTLQDALAVSPEETCVFGDNFNDISMFKESGLSICMKNGPLPVQKYASKISELTNNECGVAVELEKLIRTKQSN